MPARSAWLLKREARQELVVHAPRGHPCINSSRLTGYLEREREREKEIGKHVFS